MVNKRFQNALLGCNLKNNRMISVRVQGKPFNITVIQVYAPTSNAVEAEVEWFYEDLQDLLEQTPKEALGLEFVYWVLITWKKCFKLFFILKYSTINNRLLNIIKLS